VDWIRQWWRQPDRYDWLTYNLAAQGQQRPLRMVMSAMVATLAAVPVLMCWSPAGPHGVVPALVASAASLLCLTAALMWLRRWPTRGQSRALALIAAVCVAAAALSCPDPKRGLLYCAVFAAITGLVAFTHTAAFLVLISAIAALSVTGCATRIALDGDPAAALADLFLVLAGILAVPAVGQVLIQMLGTTAVQSDIDPLTGLPNRRGFHRASYGLVARAQGPVGVIVADLDSFKHINDTRGHAAGDQLLATIGRMLRRLNDQDIITARFGGEEFVLAGALGDDELIAHAEWVRRQIAGLPDGVTISVGSAVASVSGIDDQGIRPCIDRLIEAADTAMYQAKKAGGNRSCHAGDVGEPR